MEWSGVEWNGEDEEQGVTTEARGTATEVRGGYGLVGTAKGLLPLSPYRLTRCITNVPATIAW